MPDAVVKPSHVVVTCVKIPVEAFVAPIVVPLIVPPLIVALEEVRLIAFKVVPLAVVKPSQEEVAFVAVRLYMVSVVPLAVVKPSHVVVT